MTTSPAPFTTPDVDCRNLEWFPLNVEKLLGSDTWALATGDEFKAAVTLWCRAWKQIPAGSLPNDPRILAAAAGATVTRWRKLSAVALRGFVLCSDGRLYHRVLCEEARRAREHMDSSRAERDGDVERKRRERDARAQLFAQLRSIGHTPVWNIPTRDLRDLVARLVTSPVTAPVTEEVTPVPGVVTVLQGQVQGQGQGSPTPPPPPVVSPRETSTAAATAALSKRVKGVKPHDVRDAVLAGSLYRLLVAFGAHVGGDRDVEWQRDTDGLQIGVVALIFAWMRWKGDRIREPSGFRRARAAWQDLTIETRRDLYGLLEEFGLSGPGKATL